MVLSLYISALLLQISNLKKILKGILDYNHEILGQQINDFILPDVNLVGEHSDAAELGRMLQLILGCAVNCEQKQVDEEWGENMLIRHSSDKVAKLEGMVDSYKKKLEDLGDLRRQVKLLEEKNTLYMQNTVSLEEELRKANAARGQLETYKRQVVELQNRLSEESKKADKMEFEYKRLKEKVDSLQKEKDRLRTERDSLKETIEELRCVQAQEGQLTAGLVPLGSQDSTDCLAAEIVTPEYRERLIRLQHENKILKLNQEGSDNEKIALLQSLLEDANSRKNELETENRLVNQRLLEVQSQVEELQKSLQEQGSKADDSIILKKKYEEHLKEYEKTKGQRDHEEKLIVSAWYNMGMALQKKAAEDRLASTGSGQSFLARQRQATSARRSYPGHVQPATAR
ncbi:UNVERIFIED_CONTAM: hypothetical protein FKN15_051429 [Acipenser sinensis]